MLISNLMIVYFSLQESVASDASARELDMSGSYGRWKQQDIQYCKLKDYDLTYSFYSKFPS